MKRPAQGSLAVVSIAFAMALTALPAAAGDFNLDAGSHRLEWIPTASWAGIELTVSGPDGFYLRQSFGPGETPSLSVFDAAGSALADGSYAWELRATPVVPEAVKELMERSRQEGGADVEQRLAGEVPPGLIEAGYFSILGGELVTPGQREPEPAGSAGSGEPYLATRATVLTTADGVIRNSLCVGFDCPNNPVFSDSTILLMENNTRIKFGDTSNSPFPNNDWEIEANSSLSGGQSYLGFNDCGTADNDGGCATDLVFAVEAGARQNALYVESDGDVGMGTSNPAVNIHVVDGNTPTLRLEQDGSSGFAAQSWDVAGNETSFFIRDVTSGSTLPFRIRPGAASNSLVIDTDDDVGVGILSPSAALHVRRTSGDTQLLVEEASGTEAVRDIMRLVNNGRVRWEMEDTSANGQTWTFFSAEDEFNISSDSTAGQEFQLQGNGDLTLTGDIFTSSCPAGCGPDYVFESDYPLMPLSEVGEFIKANKHLPNVPSAEERRTAQKMSLGQFQFTLLEKVEELTLYTLDQHEQIAAQQEVISALREQNAELESRLADLEAALGPAQP